MRIIKPRSNKKKKKKDATPSPASIVKSLYREVVKIPNQERKIDTRRGGGEDKRREGYENVEEEGG